MLPTYAIHLNKITVSGQYRPLTEFFYKLMVANCEILHKENEHPKWMLI